MIFKETNSSAYEGKKGKLCSCLVPVCFHTSLKGEDAKGFLCKLHEKVFVSDEGYASPKYSADVRYSYNNEGFLSLRISSQREALDYARIGSVIRSCLTAYSGITECIKELHYAWVKVVYFLRESLDFVTSNVLRDEVVEKFNFLEYCGIAYWAGASSLSHDLSSKVCSLIQEIWKQLSSVLDYAHVRCMLYGENALGSRGVLKRTGTIRVLGSGTVGLFRQRNSRNYTILSPHTLAGLKLI